MGKTDSATKVYMGNPVIFADAFNFYMFGGRRILDSEKLRPLDTSEIGILSEIKG